MVKAFPNTFKDYLHMRFVAVELSNRAVIVLQPVFTHRYSRLLMGATTPGQDRPKSNGDESCGPIFPKISQL